MKGKFQKMMIFGFLADGKGLKLDQIPPVSRYITHKIKDYIPCVFFKVNRASNWTKPPLYLGKKGFFGGFYSFPSKSENDTKHEKNW